MKSGRTAVLPYCAKLGETMSGIKHMQFLPTWKLTPLPTEKPRPERHDPKLTQEQGEALSEEAADVARRRRREARK